MVTEFRSVPLNSHSRLSQSQPPPRNPSKIKHRPSVETLVLPHFWVWPQIPTERPAQTAQANRSSGEWVCDRKVGFLFKRTCDRTTALGCPYCRDGQSKLDQDPYWLDYDLYPGYGIYRPGSWGYEYYRDRAYYCYNRESRNVDFTEADAASFEEELDTDYEMNFGAS